jgi:hypothetical protein
MKFRKWVEAQGGTTKLGAALGVVSQTVEHWLNGTSTPKALMMQRLVKLGRGAFSYDDIINETKKSRAAK